MPYINLDYKNGLKEEIAVIKKTRLELYQLIWSIGLVKTAKELGVPYEKFRQSVTAANIPVPSARYWTMKNFPNALPKSPLPESKSTYVEIPEKPKKVATVKKINQLTKKPKISRVTEDKEQSIQESVSTTETNIPNSFKKLNLTNYEKIVKAYQQITIPKQIPRHPQDLIANIIAERKASKQRERFDYRQVYTPPKPTIWFHSRSESETENTTLIEVNSLLAALEEAGAKLSLSSEKKDIEIDIEGARIILSCHLPTHQVLLSPSDKRYDQYSSTVYERTDEIIRFGLKTGSEWSDSKAIAHTSEDTDEVIYLRRVFAKIIGLIPKSRKEIANDKIREEQRQAERIEEERQRDIHSAAVDQVSALLQSVQRHAYANQIRAYEIMTKDSLDDTKREWIKHIADWIENPDTNDAVLTQQDRKEFINEYFNPKSVSSSLYRIYWQIYLKDWIPMYFRNIEKAFGRLVKCFFACVSHESHRRDNPY